MSRLLQRALRKDTEGGQSEEEQSEEEAIAASAPRHAFTALLGSDGESGQDSGSDGEPEEAPKEQVENPPPVTDRGTHEGPETASEAIVAPADAPSSGGRRKGKQRSGQKGGAKAVSPETVGPSGARGDAEAEETLLLKLAAMQAREEAVAVAEADKAASAWRVDPKTLEAEAELRRRFGARAVRAAQSEVRAGRGGRGVRGGPRNPPPRRRGLLVTPKDWPRPDPGYTQELLLQRDSQRDEDGTLLFAFDVSARYGALLLELEVLAQHTADPSMLVELVHHEPGHVDALLRLHAIARTMGQREQSGDFLERAIHCLELSFHPAFTQAWLRGAARMDYNARAANRPFFHSLHLHAVSLSLRGCPKAALGAARLLLSLDRSDPTSMLLWFDIFALRADEPAALLAIQNDVPAASHLPGWAMSRALAMFSIANKSAETFKSSDANTQLASALLSFPELLPAVLPPSAAASASSLLSKWAERFGAGPPNPSRAHLVALYVERAAELWAEQPTLSWLTQQATALLKRLEEPTKAGESAREMLAAASAEREVWFPPRERRNRYAGDPFATLSREEVVIPEDDPQPQAQPQVQQHAEVPPQPANEGAIGAMGANGEQTEHANISAVLARLIEDTTALEVRVSEMQQILGGGAPPPSLRAAVLQRLQNLNEALTRQHIAIDAADVGEEDPRPRAAKRLLTRTVEQMCLAVEGLSYLAEA
jgi:hypothetical protein